MDVRLPVGSVLDGGDAADRCTVQLDLGARFIIKPARPATTVTGTVWVKPPRNCVSARARTAAAAMTVANPASGRA